MGRNPNTCVEANEKVNNTHCQRGLVASGGRKNPAMIAPPGLDGAIRAALAEYCPNRRQLERYVAEVCTLLQQELPNATVDEQRRRAKEFVIAYGCGWRRPLGDQEIWPKAFGRLIDWFEDGLRSVDQFLRRKVPGYDLQLGTKELLGTAKELAGRFCEGTCTCLSGSCLNRHQLSAWNPARASLRNFVLQAVKGSHGGGGRSIFPGELPRAMAGDILVAAGVVLAKVLYWECSCGKENDYGARCENCAATLNGTIHKASVKDRLVSAWAYQEQYFWHCQNRQCGNYYPEEMQSCPRCGEARRRGAARSKVWIPPPSKEAAGGSHVKELPGPGMGLEDITVNKLEVQGILQRLDPDDANILKRWADRYNAREIAEELGIAETMVRSRLKEAVTKFVDAYRLQEILSLHEEGYSEAYIAKRYGITEAEVRDTVQMARRIFSAPQSQEESVER